MSLTLASIYIFNPSGTYSSDPRARLLGFLFYSVPSNSNYPTITSGDVVLVSTFAYAIDSVARKDLIAFVPEHDSRAYVKRAIAFGGETIEIRDQRVYVNGVGLDEPYAAADTSGYHTGLPPTKIAPNHIFVLGDNRGHSADSRHYGTIQSSSVIGKIVSTQ